VSELAIKAEEQAEEAKKDAEKAKEASELAEQEYEQNPTPENKKMAQEARQKSQKR